MKLYHYDHCPYCVKARMIFGLKQVPVTLEALLNDDEATPIELIGVKQVPILETDHGHHMAESIDIIHYINAIDDAPVLHQLSNNTVIAWLANAREYTYRLAMPRWAQAPLEEFATPSARAYFTHKKEAMIGSFERQMEQSDAYISLANQHLQELDTLLASDHTVHDCGLSLDDMHVFAILRSLSIVKSITYPEKVEGYRQHMSHVSHVPLHDDIAI